MLARACPGILSPEGLISARIRVLVLDNSPMLVRLTGHSPSSILSYILRVSCCVSGRTDATTPDDRPSVLSHPLTRPLIRYDTHVCSLKDRNISAGPAIHSSQSWTPGPPEFSGIGIEKPRSLTNRAGGVSKPLFNSHVASLFGGSVAVVPCTSTVERRISSQQRRYQDLIFINTILPC